MDVKTRFREALATIDLVLVGRRQREKIKDINSSLDFAVGWVKWSGGRPSEHALVRLDDGMAPPRREQLGDHDTDSWELCHAGIFQSISWRAAQ
jgi:hypothetical protein